MDTVISDRKRSIYSDCTGPWACCLRVSRGRKRRSRGKEISDGIHREKALYASYLSSTSHPRTSEPSVFDGKRKKLQDFTATNLYLKEN